MSGFEQQKNYEAYEKARKMNPLPSNKEIMQSKLSCDTHLELSDTEILKATREKEKSYI